MADPRVARCYMYFIKSIPRAKREDFEKWLRGLKQFNKALPEGCRFAQVYRVNIGSNVADYQIHFEFENFSQLDVIYKDSVPMRDFHKQLTGFFGDCTTTENWVLTRLD